MFINLTKGKVASIDFKDYLLINKHSWHTFPKETNNGVYFYARSYIDGKMVFMHSFIMGKKEGYIIDHVNRNGLDNRRLNLRFVTYSQSLQNRGKMGDGLYKGVCYYKSKDTWEVNIGLNNKKHFLGRYKDPLFAAKIYDAYASFLHGDFSCVNFPKDIDFSLIKEKYLNRIYSRG